jgi:hypothetical protein
MRSNTKQKSSRRKVVGQTTITIDVDARQKLERLKPRGFTLKGYVGQLVDAECTRQGSASESVGSA